MSKKRTALSVDGPPVLEDGPGGPHEAGTGQPLNTDAVKEAEKPATGPVGEIIMIDALHEVGKPPRFKHAALVRCAVMSRNEKTKQPERVIHRSTHLAADCAVTVDEYIDGDIGKYRCTIARDDADKP